ncbi:TraR/DksA family transcriptional regulator [Bauldia litoralis]|uniref:TraR/DksA family transcriptional regulator n=1 Tax=Bauldia litoralis TaxID=665467 RepID=UPI0032657501
MDLEAARDRLIAARAELEALREQSAEARAPVTLDQQSVGRLSRMDALQGQAMAQAAEQRRASEMARIDAALIRIDDGSYGECLRCGEEIAEKRLEIDPAATLCVDCARAG